MILEKRGLYWLVRDDEGKVVSRTLYRPSLDADVELPMAVRIKNAVDSFDVTDDSLWTGEGKPKMSAVEKAVGDTSITRRDVDEATGRYVRPEQE